MTRSVGRLNEVILSLNGYVVSLYSSVILNAVNKRIIAGQWTEPSLVRGLERVIEQDKSPHLRDLATDALHYVKQKGLDQHG